MFDRGSQEHIRETSPASVDSVLAWLSEPSDEPTEDLLLKVSGTEVCDLVLGIEALRHKLDSLSIKALAELQIRGTTDSGLGMRVGSWLAREAHLPGGHSRSRVSVAMKVRRELEIVGAALGDGIISYDHAKVLCDVAIPRIIDAFRPFIPSLIELVPLTTFSRWKKEVLKVAALLDQDGGHHPGDDVTDNVLRMSPGINGVLKLDGQLCGENALVVSQALSDRANQIFRRMSRDAELIEANPFDRQAVELKVPPRSTLLALALVELVRESLGKPAATSRSTTVAPRTDVSLVINAEDPNFVTDSAGAPIGDTEASVLLCDPIFQPIVMGTEGVVLDLGRKQRLVDDALRKVLHHRDGGCVWPGCENPASWCDAHHVVHWKNGGKTDRSNTGLLCRYHHGVTHRKGWEMHITEDQWFWWRTPTGHTFWSQRHGIRRSGSPPPAPGSGPPGTKPPQPAPPAPPAPPRRE